MKCEQTEWDIPMKIIWMPCTLSRVLNTIETQGRTWISYRGWRLTEHYRFWEFEEICDWKLLKANWEDALLEDQSEETKRILHSLICK
jgi:hypothetical protein